jgi:hypothetical protein
MKNDSFLERVLFQFNLFYEIFLFLSWTDLMNYELINNLFFNKIRDSEPIWRAAAAILFKNKVYIPAISRRMIRDGNKVSNRVDLQAMSIRELKGLSQVYGVNITHCFEKGEIINAIHAREIRNKLPNESLSRFALRIAFVDRTRNCIRDDEVVDFDWNIRLKGTGPLSELLHLDPWWATHLTPSQMSTTTTIVKFQRDSSLEFLFNGPSPFAHMLQNTDAKATYALERAGTKILLSFGVHEYVARHPENWGFVLQSSGSVWTSFPMPPRHSDAYLEDDWVEGLVTHQIRLGFLV